jgi:hypothetical protein
MAFVALIFSLLVAALGTLGVVSPSRLLDVVRHFQTPVGVYLAAGLRIVFGGALFFAASGSRAPEGIRFLGVVVFVAGLVTPLFGLERFRSLLRWWSARGSSFVRAWAAFALLFGLLLAYAIAP